MPLSRWLYERLGHINVLQLGTLIPSSDILVEWASSPSYTQIAVVDDGSIVISSADDDIDSDFEVGLSGSVFYGPYIVTQLTTRVRCLRVAPGYYEVRATLAGAGEDSVYEFTVSNSLYAYFTWDFSACLPVNGLSIITLTIRPLGCVMDPATTKLIVDAADIVVYGRPIPGMM